MAKRYRLKDNLQKGEVVYGEIYGEGIQKNYTYGLKNKKDLVIFDIQKDGEYIPFRDTHKRCHTLGLKVVPVLNGGRAIRFSEIDLDKIVLGNSVFCPEQKIMEGVVIRNAKNNSPRKILKVISPDYLLKDNTDFH